MAHNASDLPMSSSETTRCASRQWPEVLGRRYGVFLLGDILSLAAWSPGGATGAVASAS